MLCPPDTDTPGFARENATKPAETRAVSAGASVLSAEQVADALLAGMAKRSFLIIPGREARFAYLVKRLARPRAAHHGRSARIGVAAEQRPF